MRRGKARLGERPCAASAAAFQAAAGSSGGSASRSVQPS